jgi:hypothetical protein
LQLATIDGDKVRISLETQTDRIPAPQCESLDGPQQFRADYIEHEHTQMIIHTLFELKALLPLLIHALGTQNYSFQEIQISVPAFDVQDFTRNFRI